MENDMTFSKSNRCNKSIIWGFFWGIIAILIGACTYGLGTVTLASSIFLGLFGGMSVSSFCNSLFNLNSPCLCCISSIFEDGVNFEEKNKKYKRNFIATLVIGCIFSAAAILIGILTFGVGVIPLGTFSAVVLTAGFGTLGLLKLLKSLFNVHKIAIINTGNNFKKISDTTNRNEMNLNARAQQRNFENQSSPSYYSNLQSFQPYPSQNTSLPFSYYSNPHFQPYPPQNTSLPVSYYSNLQSFQPYPSQFSQYTNFPFSRF